MAWCEADLCGVPCYQVMEHLGAAAFSRAVQARDLRTGALVCLKVVKVASVLSRVCQI